MNHRTSRRRTSPWAQLWPGLASAWERGSWGGLALAIGFTVLLNVTIVTIAVWPAWLPPQVTLACGLMALLLGLWAGWNARRELRRVAEENTGAGSAGESGVKLQTEDRAALDELFMRAQQNYLRGDWLGAEQTLSELLKRDHEDFAAELLLATMLRRTGRLIEAERKLTALERREAAVPWRLELSRERARIAVARTPATLPIETQNVKQAA